MAGPTGTRACTFDTHEEVTTRCGFAPPCRHFGNDFYLHSLYHAGPDDQDRCPHCGRHLGVVGVHRLARRIDELGTQLTTAQVQLAEAEPAMRIDPDPICQQVCAAAHQAASAQISDLAARRVGLTPTPTKPAAA